MKLPKSYYNLISFVGTIIAGLSLFMIIIFSIVGFIYEDTSSYIGLFTFIIVPGFLILGLVLLLPTFYCTGVYMTVRQINSHMNIVDE